MRRLSDVYRRTMRWLLIATLLALLTIMGLQIVFRYALNASLIWAEEVCRYLLIWVSFLACADAYERGEVAAVNLLRDSLPSRFGLMLAIAVNLLAIVLMAVLVIYGFSYADRVGSEPIPGVRFLLNDLFGSSALAPQMFWVYAALPIGLSLLMVRLMIDIVQYLRLFTRGGTASDLRLPAGSESGR